MGKGRGRSFPGVRIALPLFRLRVIFPLRSREQRRSKPRNQDHGLRYGNFDWLAGISIEASSRLLYYSSVLNKGVAVGASEFLCVDGGRVDVPPQFYSSVDVRSWVHSRSECTMFVVRSAELQSLDKDRIAWRKASCMAPGAGANKFLIFRCSTARALILMFLEDITLKQKAKEWWAKSVSDNGCKKLN